MNGGPWEVVISSGPDGYRVQRCREICFYRFLRSTTGEKPDGSGRNDDSSIERFQW